MKIKFLTIKSVYIISFKFKVFSDNVIHFFDDFIDILRWLAFEHIRLIVWFNFQLVLCGFLAIIVHVQFDLVFCNFRVDVLVGKIQASPFSIQSQNTRFIITKEHLLLQYDRKQLLILCLFGWTWTSAKSRCRANLYLIELNGSGCIEYTGEFNFFKIWIVLKHFCRGSFFGIFLETC